MTFAAHRRFLRGMLDNPFLDPAFHICWSALKPEAVGPGIDAALAKAQAAIDVIAARDIGTVTYERTFLALEHATGEMALATAIDDSNGRIDL